MSELLKLPVDILIIIMGNLSCYTDLSNVMLTCKRLRDLIKHNSYIWRLVSWNQNLLIVHNPNSKIIKISGYQRSRISLNWCKGIFQNKVVLHYQTNFMPWLRMYNSQAFFISMGSELQCFATDRKGFPNCNKMLWNLQVPIVQRNDVRTNDISRFVAKHGMILCGNRDGCVAVYKIKGFRDKPHLLHHIKDCHDDGNSEVTSVELIKRDGEKSFAVTASYRSPKLRFWCIKPESNNYTEEENSISNLIKCTNEIELGKKIGIKCLSLNSTEEKLAIGPNGNSEPLLLDVSSGKLLLTSSSSDNVNRVIRDIGWHNENTIMYVTHSGFLQLLDIRTGKLVFYAMDPFQSTMYCARSDNLNAIVVGTAEYSRCVLFDSRKARRHVQMYFTHKKSSPIYSLDFDTRKLIAACDRSVAVLNFTIDAKSVKTHDFSEPFLRDGCVAVYKIKGFRDKPHLLHHIKDCHDDGNSEVTSVELIKRDGEKSFAVTASYRSPKLRFWCIKPESNNYTEEENSISNLIKCTNEIEFGKKIGIKCLSLNSTEEKLAIGPNGNSEPLLLDVSSGKLLLTSSSSDNVNRVIRDIGWHNENTIMYVTHSGFLQLLDIRTGKLVFYAMDPFQSTMYCARSDNLNAIVVGTAEYSRCVLFDSRKARRHVQMYFTHKKSSPIYSLDFDTRKLIAACDRSVAVLNFTIDAKSVKTHDFSEPFLR